MLISNRLLVLCVLAGVTAVAVAEPPLTTKERIAAAESTCSVVLTAMKETDTGRGKGLSKLRLAPKIVAKHEKDPLNKRDGVEITARLDARSHSTVLFRCNTDLDSMVIKLTAFAVQFSPVEADPSRDKSLDVLQDVLQAWLNSQETLTDEHRQHVLDEWNTHRPRLFAIGESYEFVHQAITYTFWTNGTGRNMTACVSIR